MNNHVVIASSFIFISNTSGAATIRDMRSQTGSGIEEKAGGWNVERPWRAGDRTGRADTWIDEQAGEQGCNGSSAIRRGYGGRKRKGCARMSEKRYKI